jgi:hypothetical protein
MLGEEKQTLLPLFPFLPLPSSMNIIKRLLGSQREQEEEHPFENVVGAGVEAEDEHPPQGQVRTLLFFV